MPSENPEFFDNRDFPWTRMLEENWQDIRQELDNLPKDAFGQWPRDHMFDNQWNLFLFRTPGRRFDKNCELCPKTAALVDKIPGLTMATYSWLRPQSAIKAHVGFTTIVLRSHLALKVPEGGDIGFRVGKTSKRWEEGKVMVFDDMHNHEAWNWSDEERVVLMLDFLRPWKFRTSALGHIRQRIFPPKDYKQSYDYAISEAEKFVETEDPRLIKS
ncbi:MAG: aspartyl/asparaginyl beta-hydroxylase domain-containing protein [Planctomycetota bacterium]|nr:MAG: aspartyl/asparaginyl beta-hydroxylase domain-containing protein [Planctomycetota bacterium]